MIDTEDSIYTMLIFLKNKMKHMEEKNRHKQNINFLK